MAARLVFTRTIQRMGLSADTPVGEEIIVIQQIVSTSHDACNLTWKKINIPFYVTIIAVVVTGGSDSLALTLLARQAFRKVIGITVDHRLI